MNTDALININGGRMPTLELFLILTIISLMPSILVMMTSFTRIVIILSFTRNALGIQQTPPNMVLVGIALFLTLFIMDPVIKDINTNAYQPYLKEEIKQEEAIKRAEVPMKRFMLKQTETSTLNVFTDLSKIEKPENLEDLPMTVVIPSFMTSELKRAFTAGFMIFLPFMLVDIIVSSTLMSMGMVMLPPAMISLPFKLLLFVTINGWELLFTNLVKSFHY
ncbi:flagellar biosynthetic protein FliP [Lacrimispora xylanolytica]|jgi:flagellar biosynthetic protein FliP|uniref:Flagellar biosynthetic protein FliP n=1 Tax=Lacrimispora xylanolytica TaxID=29375 RepID=A0ABY7ADR9_9FIRM|nr:MULTISPECIES: flagellar type III secretion system pore protein FliP [Clostridia]MBS5955892.1 flagellar type III secretion system pore protein FliP [Clostridiales bacterium]WAJ24716.1 flagellar type III secretion system pore protein FliP [Lacrimispora xylanolytica]